MNIRKHLRRTPWHVYAALVALFLWSVVLGIYVGEAIAQAPSEPPCGAELVEAEPEQPAAVLAAAVEDKPVEESEPELLELGTFKITHYCPCSKCCGKWADGYTATGTKATQGRTIAVDPDVIPYGTEVLVFYEDGSEAVYIAEDCGGAIQGNRIDVYMDSHEAALVGGVKAAEVYVREAKT